MLVLSRQRDETIIIGDNIELTVVDIRGDKVRLGIKAPASVSVHRKEVHDAIRRENERAAGIAASFRGMPPARSASSAASRLSAARINGTRPSAKESA